MLKFSVKSDIDRAKRFLTSAQREQIPFAASLALNNTAKRVEAIERKEIGSDFDRPKPQTTTATYVNRSTKTNLTAEVGLKSRINGVPADEYLLANIKGGARADKRSELLLRNIGILPAGMQTIPGKSARLDQFGNMSRGQIVQILSYFEAFGTRLSSERSAKLNRSQKTLAKIRDRAPYFVVPVGDRKAGLYPGIWQRHGKEILPVLMFVRRGHYKVIFDFLKIAEKEASSAFPGEFSSALERALATAR